MQKKEILSHLSPGTTEREKGGKSDVLLTIPSVGERKEEKGRRTFPLREFGTVEHYFCSLLRLHPRGGRAGRRHGYFTRVSTGRRKEGKASSSLMSEPPTKE